MTPESGEAPGAPAPESEPGADEPGRGAAGSLRAGDAPGAATGEPPAGDAPGARPVLQEQVFSFAIVGAGVSGLCLAWQLVHSVLSGEPILLVDGARDDDVLRTLSFWAAGPTPFEDLVRSRWRTLEIRAGGEPLRVALEAYEYRTLFFADLQRLVKGALSRAPHAVVEGRAQAVTDRGTHVEIEVAGRVYRARWAFDSRFRKGDLAVDARRHHLLWQHFRGVVVRAPSAGLDPSAAVFLDFRSRLPRGRAFFYVLPHDAGRALVELVTLDPADADAEIERYLREELGLPASDYEVVDREAGVSPMTERPFPWKGSARIRNIGVASGRLKASTGYAFTRILEDGAAIVSSLTERGHPMVPPPRRLLYRLMDGVLLELWTCRAELIPGLFDKLFRKNPADRVLRFLDERASFRDLMGIVLSMPALLMLSAVFRWFFRRSTRFLRPG